MFFENKIKKILNAVLFHINDKINLRNNKAGFYFIQIRI